MTRAYRGPVALSTAGALLAVAVVAYLLGDLQSNMRRQEEALFDRETRRDSRASAIEIREELASQRAAINQWRRRLDDLTKRVDATNQNLEELKRAGTRAPTLGQPERFDWPEFGDR